ncbi:MAG: PEP-CTERM sorting domain-containing protein [Chthonomonas sp.]|nr:PEP-CTERM sorting domain-containing protein [Chthonomonas sp.]
MRKLCTAVAAGLAVFAAVPASGTLFYDSFDTDTSASWTVNKGPNPANNYATFAVNYAPYNIPSAPGSTGGTTSGLMLESNVAGGIFSGLSASPTGLNITGDFIMTADVWLNFIGPGPAGGSGSTQLGGLGFGTAGTTAQWGGGTQDSTYMAVTTDGNSASDYRLYSPGVGGTTSYASGNAVYAAPGGAINESNAYYTAAFPSVSLPGTQNGFGTQTGSTRAGSSGFKWRKWTVTRTGTVLTYWIDSLKIATINHSSYTMGGSNLAISYFDSNSTSSIAGTPRLNFMLVDNIRVVPEPATFVAMGLGVVALLRRKRRS